MRLILKLSYYSCDFLQINETKIMVALLISN